MCLRTTIDGVDSNLHFCRTVVSVKTRTELMKDLRNHISTINHRMYGKFRTHLSIRGERRAVDIGEVDEQADRTEHVEVIEHRDRTDKKKRALPSSIKK